MGIQDPTILQADIEAVQRVTENYGLAAIQTCKDALQRWYDTHRWDIAPSDGSTDEDTSIDGKSQTQSETASA